jgi:DNA (cytosine-5)-methyltransferase 1
MENKKIRVLNLYAGIGGNRNLWDNNKVEVTSVEYDEDIANEYKKLYPQDTIIVGDAIEYFLEHYKEFDFIWASPPCPTHSRMRLLCMQQNSKAKLPDMDLYGIIIFLKHFFKGKWVIENVITYYDPLIKPQKVGNHYYWSNFPINYISEEKRQIIRMSNKDSIQHKKKMFGIDVTQSELSVRKIKLMYNNCVDPKTGLKIFNQAYNTCYESKR